MTKELLEQNQIFEERLKECKTKNSDIIKE